VDTPRHRGILSNPQYLGLCFPSDRSLTTQESSGNPLIHNQQATRSVFHHPCGTVTSGMVLEREIVRWSQKQERGGIAHKAAVKTLIMEQMYQVLPESTEFKRSLSFGRQEIRARHHLGTQASRSPIAIPRALPTVWTRLNIRTHCWIHYLLIIRLVVSSLLMPMRR